MYVEYLMLALSWPDAFAAASVKSAVLVLIRAVPLEVCHRSLGYQVESLTANYSHLCCIHTISSLICLLSSTAVSDAKTIEFKKQDV